MENKIVKIIFGADEKEGIGPMKDVRRKERCSMCFEEWLNADLAGCFNSRCSMIGYILKVGDSTVYWQSKWQATTSPSILESEYVAMSEAMKHG